jgi:general secretion pathway protein C
MQERLVAHKAAMEQRTAQLEQQLRRLVVLLQRVPLQRWQWLVILLLVIWLSHSLARLFWLVVPNPEIPPASISLIAENGSGVGPADAVNIAQLKMLSPFGSTDAPEAAQVVEAQPGTQGIEDDAADTQLNLVLRGVLGSNKDEAGRAIIVAGDHADVYAIGDTLPVGTNVTLAKVLDVRVIINNNGTFESLWLFKDDPNAPQITSFAPAPDANRNPRGYADPPYQQQPPVYVDRSQGDSPRFGPDIPDTDAVARSLADVVAMSIYRENGQVIGYKIRPGRNAELFNSLGLQTDDIVTAVNGVALSNPGKIMEIYKSMGNTTSANLEIRRGGSTVNLDVMLK